MGFDKRDQLLTFLKKHSLEHGEYTLTSGQSSDVYVDVRKTALHSKGGFLIGSAIVEYISERFPSCRGVGGLTLGADPIISSVLCVSYAKEIGLFAGLIVRKEEKDHGTGQRIEGPSGLLNSGDLLIALDDVTTTGQSLLESIGVLRSEGFHVPAAISVVDRNQGAGELFREHDVTFESLFDIRELTGENDGDTG